MNMMMMTTMTYHDDKDEKEQEPRSTSFSYWFCQFEGDSRWIRALSHGLGTFPRRKVLLGAVNLRWLVKQQSVQF